jgi:L-2-hydroxyglutarate oxidase LhgO
MNSWPQSPPSSSRDSASLYDVDCIVIGAGVVGLAVARALARDGREVFILERERHFGMHTSSRNSEVIHAGIHYPPHSLKATLCREGRELLYRYCAERGIAHRRCGKLTVATTPEQLPTLEAIAANARANDVLDLEWWDAAQARRAEPQLNCLRALSSPSTGIIDSHGYMQALLADAEASGAVVAYGTAVSRMRPTSAGIEVSTGDEAAPIARARWVINCAGLWADRVAASIEGLPPQYIPTLRFAKGSYFAVSGAAPFSQLVYPAPQAGGHLGIHVTLDLGGAARLGPDTQWVDTIDYAVEPARAAMFAAAVREYWPLLNPDRLHPAYAGIRPKILKDGEVARDFLVSAPRDHGVAGVVNLFGMDSPGLTASLAIGDKIAAITD